MTNKKLYNMTKSELIDFSTNLTFTQFCALEDGEASMVNRTDIQNMIHKHNFEDIQVKIRWKEQYQIDLDLAELSWLDQNRKTSANFSGY